jgi:hypothetical protein
MDTLALVEAKIKNLEIQVQTAESFKAMMKMADEKKMSPEQFTAYLVTKYEVHNIKIHKRILKPTSK